MGCFAMKLSYEDQLVLFSTVTKMAISTLFIPSFWRRKGIQLSILRKGNSPDKGMMESFFGILKSEMFYGYEKSFQSLKQLEQAIVDYINYYNNKRIKVKLKHTKISSEEISDGRKYSLLFRYVKVVVSC